MELPDFVEAKLKDAATKTPSTTIESLREEFEKIYEDDFIQSDPSFDTDESRQKYALQVFWTRFVGRPPIKPYTIIPVGVDSIRKNKSSGILTTSLFALDKTKKLRRISLKGEICSIVDDITFFSAYKDVQLGSFKDSQDLQADDRAEFNHPVEVDVTPEELIKMLNIPYVTIKDAKDNLSKVGSDGYVHQNDWRAVRGIINTSSQAKEDSESQWGVYHIRDETIPADAKSRVTKSGQVITPGMSLWVSPNIMLYDRDSDCIFLGPTVVAKDKKTKKPTGEINMNCYCIIPIHPRYST